MVLEPPQVAARHNTDHKRFRLGESDGVGHQYRRRSGQGDRLQRSQAVEPPGEDGPRAVGRRRSRRRLAAHLDIISTPKARALAAMFV